MIQYEMPLGEPGENETPVIIHAGQRMGKITLAWPVVAAVSYRSYRRPCYLLTLDLVGFFELRGEGQTIEEALDCLGGAIAEVIMREAMVPADELTETRRMRLRNVARIIS